MWAISILQIPEHEAQDHLLSELALLRARSDREQVGDSALAPCLPTRGNHRSRGPDAASREDHRVADGTGQLDRLHASLHAPQNRRHNAGYEAATPSIVWFRRTCAPLPEAHDVWRRNGRRRRRHMVSPSHPRPARRSLRARWRQIGVLAPAICALTVSASQRRVAAGIRSIQTCRDAEEFSRWPAARSCCSCQAAHQEWG